MGGAVSTGENNDDLIDNLLDADYIKSPDVESVFRAVDRAHYLTDECKHKAYKDGAWKSGNLHISAPCIYSEVMESLKLSPGLSFLNLGSGTGYLSTMAGLILGPYGINHGVEIHEDVTQYAHDRLAVFCKTSYALERYEFCKPKFVQGNCLNISAEERQYDRVYCGAGCPEHHENYMKNLIKIGGVLVMPLNDQLLQIIRTSETTWDVKSVLPVSYASLVVPTQNLLPESVKLPDSEPLCLQDICRSTIRTLLRTNVELEHPELKPFRHVRKIMRRKRCMRRYVVPIFEASNDEYPGVRDMSPHSSPSFDLDRGSGDQMGIVVRRAYRPHDLRASLELATSASNPANPEVSDMSQPGRASPSYDLDQGSGDQMGTVLNWARGLRHVYRPHDLRASLEPATSASNPANPEVREGTAEARLVSSPSQRNEIHKRVKFDSGIVEDMENGKGLSSDSEDVSLESDSDSELSVAVPIPIRTICFERDGTFQPTDFNPTTTHSSGAEDSDESSPCGSGESGQVSDEDNTPQIDPDLFGACMRSKIQALPLPLQMKSFLNLYRDF